MTSYKTSKQLWEAGMRPEPPCSVVSEHGEMIKAGSELELAHFTMHFPCYDLGTLVREFEKHSEWVMITFDGGAYIADALHNSYSTTTTDDDVPHFSDTGDTPEDAAGLLLVKLLTK